MAFHKASWTDKAKARESFYLQSISSDLQGSTPKLTIPLNYYSGFKNSYLTYKLILDSDR